MIIYRNLVLCLILVTSAGVLARADFPPPPDAKVEWVGRNMNVNGITSAVRAFHTKKSIESVVQFYRHEWREPVDKDMPGFVETIDNYPWYIISRIEDGIMMTVQVQVRDKNGTGSWGYLSEARLPNPKSDYVPGEKAPKLPGSTVINEVLSDDPGKEATTFVIANEHSVSSNISFYRNYYKSRGYTVETDKMVGEDKLHSLVFKSNRNRITMMLMESNDGTNVVINEVINTIF